MTIALDRRQFLLGSAAHRRARAFRLRRAWRRARETAAARALYDSIFEGMLRASPEIATGLGLDTGELAYPQEPAERFRRRPARWAATTPLARASAAAAPDRPRRRCRARERAWLDTVDLARRAGVRRRRRFAYGGVRRLLSDPLRDLAADRLLSGRARFPRQPAQDRDPRRRRGLCRPARGVRRATSISRSTRPAPMPAAASSRPPSSSTRR